MRQLGTVADEQAARHFADYLLAKGIAVSIEHDYNGWQIWARDEDHLDDARREFAEFALAPDAPLYRGASLAAAQLRTAEKTRARRARKNFVDVSRRWQRGSAARQPVTLLLIVASVGVTLFSHYGADASVTAPLFMDHYEPVPYVFNLGTWQFGPPNEPFPLAHAWRTEPWRLVTPIFLHFAIWHILFNMMTLWQLGRPIEAARGSWRFALLVLAIAIPSNIAQYVWSGPSFGGMSGVLYGLFGYLWMKSRYEPSTEFYVTQGMVIWMIGWSVMCMAGILGPIGNAAHTAGLIVGIILGRWPSLWRSLR
jgi:GlpG protein